MTSARPTKPGLLGIRGGAAFLTESQRLQLVTLVRAHPNATDGQIRLLFRDQAGRILERSTIRYVRHRGYQAAGLSATNVRLTEAQKSLLRTLIEASAPEYCRADVAREFAAVSGRSITSAAVGRFAVKIMGLPKLTRGVNSAILARDGVEARIVEERARKFEQESRHPSRRSAR